MTAEREALERLAEQLRQQLEAVREEFRRCLEGVEDRLGRRLEAVRDEFGRRLEAVESRIEWLEERLESAIHTLRLDVEELRNDLSYARRLGGVPAARRPVRPQMPDGSGLVSGARDELVDVPPYVE